MKTIISIAVIALTFSISSCHKCETCTAYNPNGSKNLNLNSIELCNKTDIKSYETGTKFTDPTGAPVTFTCVASE